MVVHQPVRRAPSTTNVPPSGSSAELPEPQAADAVYRLDGPCGIGYAVADVPREWLRRLIDFPELPFRGNAGETIKTGRSASLIRSEWPLRTGSSPVVYRRIQPRNVWKILTGFFRPSRAWKAWKLGHLFRARGIPTARPLAVVLPKPRRWTGRTFLMTEWIEGGQNLHWYAESLRDLDTATQRIKVRTAAECLGRTLGRMHAAGLSHRDLKPSNLLLADDGGRTAVYLIDLDGASVAGRLSSRRQWRDLARLAIGVETFPDVQRTVRLRFLRAYLDASSGSRMDWKNAWYHLERTARSLRGRKRRGGTSRR